MAIYGTGFIPDEAARFAIRSQWTDYGGTFGAPSRRAKLAIGLYRKPIPLECHRCGGPTDKAIGRCCYWCKGEL